MGQSGGAFTSGVAKTALPFSSFKPKSKVLMEDNNRLGFSCQFFALYLGSILPLLAYSLIKFPHHSLPPCGAHVCEAVLSDLTDFLGALIRPLPPSADPTLGAPARPPDADGGGPNGAARLGRRGRAFPSLAASSPGRARPRRPRSVGPLNGRAAIHPSSVRPSSSARSPGRFGFSRSMPHL